jgi:hypothetical protein
MTRLARALAAAALLAAAPTALAEEGGVRVGFGVGFNVFDGVSGDALAAFRTSFYLPIRLGTFTIEPMFAGYSSSTKGESSDHPALGVGVLWRFKEVEQTAFYTGARLGLSPAKHKVTGLADENRDAFMIAPVFGAEHPIAAAFSIGAEAQIEFIHVNGGNGVPARDIQSTAALAFLRFYFK